MKNKGRKERMTKLEEAGINTGKYFNICLPDGLKPGATISLVIAENGQPEIAGPKAIESMMRFKDEYEKTTPTNPWPGCGPNFYLLDAQRGIGQIRSQIITDGYVRNTKLHRRFVMAQMFHMLDYVSYNGRESGYNACLRNMYGYQYTLNMMLEEVRVLSKLESRDKESFEERSHFFTQEVVVSVLADYLEKLRKYVEDLPDRKCKGVPYKRVKGMNIFNSDLEKKLFSPIHNNILHIASAKNYTEIHKLLEKFMRSIIKLPHDTPKSKVWIDAFKGAGAYYTLKNLVMFHDCFIDDNGSKLTGLAANYYLRLVLDEYKGSGWKMFALMKKVIKINNFDFNTRMVEIGVYE